MENIKIYKTADGVDGAYSEEEVSVAFTDDLKTFVFDPPVLGSPSEDTNYTVFFSDKIQNSVGNTVLNPGGYQWTFGVGNELDLTPPQVRSVIPRANGEYDRNIIVQIDFSEAIDPTSSRGVFDPTSIDPGTNFDNIKVNSVIQNLATAPTAPPMATYNV